MPPSPPPPSPSPSPPPPSEDEMKEDNKINIYLHVVDTNKLEATVVSMLYIIEKDRRDFINNINNNSSSCVHEGKENPPPLIEPVLKFDCTETIYPSGMACVYLNSRFYFMGGSISYTTYLTRLTIYEEEGVYYKYRYRNSSFDDVIQAFEDTLECFPADVYVFDCVRRRLVSPEDEDTTLMIPPMNSGKPSNPITFVIGNQIYVLSSQMGPQGMIHFESINPISRKRPKRWDILTSPPQHDLLFSDQTSTVFGSCVMDHKLFVIFSLSIEFHLLCYDTVSAEWTSRQVSSLYHPHIYRDSVFLGDTIYTAVNRPYDSNLHFGSPLLSYTPVSAATILDENLGIHKLKCNRIRRPDRDNWPIYDDVSGFSTRCLLNLGRHLNGANPTVLGFVEVFKSDCLYECDLDTVSIIRFFVFEPLEVNSDRHVFDAKTFYAGRLSTDLRNYSDLNAAGVFTS